MPDLRPREKAVAQAPVLQARDSVATPSSLRKASEAPEALRFLAQHALRKSRYGVAFPISIEFLNVCGGPDFDWFRDHFLDRGKKFVQMSVESLDPEDTSFRPVSQRVAAQALLQGAQFSLTLPPVEGVKHLGLFLCTSNRNDGRCSAKAPFRIDSSTRREMATGDALFYFSYLVLAEDVLYSAPTEIPTVFTDAHGGFHNADSPRGALQRVLPRVKQMEHDVGASPLNVNDTIARIQLQVAFKQRCGAQAR
ncbi:MAG: hypothetical protein U0136_18105 [Bdellovibrionota bacterium]